MSKCGHHHHHHHHHHRDRCECPHPGEHFEGQMPMEHPWGGFAAHPMHEGCAPPPSVPIHGRCVMTPRGPVCCVALPHHRMR